MSTLIKDPEVLAFIEKTESHYPPDAMAQTIAQQRAHYTRLCAAFARPQDGPSLGAPAAAAADHADHRTAVEGPQVML